MKCRINMPPQLESIVEDIAEKGGASYLVGGAVIDSIQGRAAKDWDIEVYKLSISELEKVLSGYGSPNLVGQSFGIIKLKFEDVEYDFSVPRRENKIGLKHQDFNIELRPDIAPEEAALRRDLTINSMYIDLSSMDIVDPYHGLDDLNSGIIRHTSYKFSEDPLRVLRIMQLLPRKGRVVAPETMDLCRALVNQYSTLPAERVFEEWNKLLMKAEKPSVGMDFLADSGWIVHYPELNSLRTTAQNPDWHAEGSVWNHTQMVVDCASLLKQYIPEEWKKPFMYGALLHDAGKPATTTKDLKSHGHDQAGVPLAKSFMQRITAEKELADRVLNIVEYHMAPGDLSRSNAKDSAWKRLHNKIPLNIIAYMSKADAGGRAGSSLNDYHEPSEKALRFFEEYGAEPIPPVLMGKHLIEAGYEPGPIIGKLLKKAYEIQIEEKIYDKEELLKRAVIA
ncbi:MAG TPA: HD domain-containing protein [Candidatus Nanoarchaeia archaeon]|nr:HD domain-containing protein [Candidatus Nanoarchaeia archaeon]